MKKTELMAAIKVLRRLVIGEFPSSSMAYIAETWDSEVSSEDIAVLAALDTLLKETETDGPA